MNLDSNILLNLLNPQLIDEPVQISASDSQGSRAFCFPPSALAQGPKNESALELANCLLVGLIDLGPFEAIAHCHRQLPDFHRRAFG